MSKVLLVFVVLSFFSSIFGSPPELSGPRNFVSYGLESSMTKPRLPSDVVPTTYFLKTWFPEDSDTFEGEVRIGISVLASTNSITLNSKDLTILAVKLYNARNFEQTVHNWTMDPSNEQMTVSAALAVKRNYFIWLSFKGRISNNNVGPYHSCYKMNNKTMKIKTTQFEATWARTAFPCFDEPQFKAPFTIELGIPKDQTAVSNMPVESTRPDPANKNLVWVTFQKSPPMPTYLVAYTISSLASYQTENCKVVTYARENAIEDAKYIHEKGCLLLKALENYLGVPYALPKLDIVALPDFDAGAMENYGHTTYREKLVLITNGISKRKDIEYGVSVVAHEFSHMWFGDLVTPGWWDYLWLNEGFARYFQYYLTNMVEPSWRLDELFVVEQVHTAMQADIKGSHPITANVNTPNEISAIFDHISYNKAGSVIRMWCGILGEEIFRSILKHYLEENMDGITMNNNLQEAMVDVLKNKVTPTLMNNFITAYSSSLEQSGYPMMHAERDYPKKNVKITQRQFSYDINDKDGNQYSLFVTYTTSSEKNFTLERARETQVFMPATQKEMEINIGSPSWFLMNIQSCGFYRVNYDISNWKELTTALLEHPDIIHPVNRAQLLDDSFNLARAKYIPFSVPLSITKYLIKEKDPIPWFAALSNLNFFFGRFYLTDVYQPLTKHVSKLITKLYEDLAKSNPQDHLQKNLLNSLSQWACNLNNENCVAFAKSEMKKFMSDASYRIPPELKESVMCTGLRLGGKAEWDAIWQHYLITNSATEKILTLGILPCTTNDEALDRIMTEMINPNFERVRSQDTYILARNLAAHGHNTMRVMQYLRFHYDLFKNSENGKEVFALILNYMKNSVTHHDHYHQLEHIRDGANTTSEHRALVNRTMEFANKNMEWSKSVSQEFLKWFAEDEQPQTTTVPPPTEAPRPTEKPSSATKPTATFICFSFALIILFKFLEL